MKRPWLLPLTVVLLGLLAGIAIAGRPTTVANTVMPAQPAATTSVAPTAGVTTSTLAAATTSTGPTTTAAPDIDRESLRVVTANGTSTLGLAGRTADQLLELGYTQVVATDTLNEAAVTTIYYRPGFAAAAAQLATDLGLAPTATAALTEPASKADDDGDLIAVLGDDLAP
jgi:hypothetical protein